MRLLLLPLLLFTAAAADPVTLTGKWQVHLSIGGTENDQTCTLTQTGGDLEGTCASAEASGKITGKVEERKVSWTYKSEYNGGPITVKYSGTVDESNNIKGSVLVEEYSAEGDFTATPAK